jgi:hypothetical protein
MSDQAFTRQRRCLNIISIALIVYFMTGVEIGRGGVDIGSFAISIRYEAIAYALVWIAFFYFWWRFYLFGKDARRLWKMDFLYELSRNKKYRNLYSQPEGASENEPTVWAPSLHAEGFRRHLSWEEAYLIGIRSDDGEIQFAAPKTFRESISPIMQKWSVGPETIIPLKWRHYWTPALKASMSAIKNKSGTEWALPNFLACFALICGISTLIIKVI